MRCEQCKHWDGLDTGAYSSWRKLFGRCKAALHEATVADQLQRDGLSWDMACKKADSIMKMSGAYVADASDYSATLYTKPDFYCGMFEEKE